jgi:hypothetical protein
VNQFPYAVAADGKRFLVLSGGEDQGDTPLSVITNWPAGVKEADGGLRVR